MANTTAADIVKGVGGAQNIKGLTHCATRLRFELKDASTVDKDTLEKISGVMGAVPQAGDRYQVVIGGAVQTVYNEIWALPEMSKVGSGSSAEDTKAAARAQGPRGKFAWIDSFFEFLSDSFRPVLGALLGASLFITFMALMATLKVIPAWNDPTAAPLSPSWQFINFCWQAVFTFLPLMVAYNATKKLGADPWIGFSVMAVLMLPGFRALAENDAVRHIEAFGSAVNVVDVWGIPLTIFDYSQQVFPPLLMAAVLGPVYKGLKRIIPDNVQLVFVPFLTMLIMIPLTAFLIGPIGVYAGAAVSGALSAINGFSPFIFAIIIPLAYPFMVPLGLHWPINAIMLLNIQNLGYDFIQGPMGAWNFACFGATAGVLVIATREKDLEMRQTATGALLAGLLGGISEPSLYGIHLRFKRIYPRMLIGCFAGGLTLGIFGLFTPQVITHAFVFTSLLTIPAFTPMWTYGIGVLVAFVVAMALVMISDYRTPEQKAEIEAARQAADKAGPEDAGAKRAALPAMEPGTVTTILSPLEGTAIPLSEVPDPVFSAGTVGPGVGVMPSSNVVYAPGPGTILVAQDTGHAFAIRLDSGIEMLIHVGIDTVNLKGEGFDVHVKKGDRVDKGTPLVTFDKDVITKAGYDLATPVLIMNHKKFGSVEQVATGPVTTDSELIKITAKEAAPAKA